MFLLRMLLLMIYWYKKCIVFFCYVIKENLFFFILLYVWNRSLYCKKYFKVFYWVLSMWEIKIDFGIFIKLVVFLIKLNGNFFNLCVYGYCM